MSKKRDESVISTSSYGHFNRKNGKDAANISNNFTNRFTNKRGQVTIFIILGILLLLAVVIIVLVQQEALVFNPGEIIPTEKGKIENYLTACISKIGEEAVTNIGLQGGYVQVPPELAYDGSLHLRISPMNVIPYWAYGMQTNIPTLQQIKERIDEHLENNLRSCLYDTKAFQESYDLVEKSNLKSATEITDSNILFKVNWDLEVRTKTGEKITELLEHTAESPIKLKRTYDTAKQIVEKEMSSLKFEDITQDLISLEHPDLPVAGMDLSCSKRQWEVGKAKSAMQDLLRINIPALKVKGTDYVEFPEELTYYQNHYIWDVGEEFSQPDVSVNFNYDSNYPFAFGVTPLEGTKMRSSQLGGSGVLSFLCLQTWKFTYDVSYPVLAQLRDETTGFIFNMAFTVHVVRNFPNRRALATARPSYARPTVTDEDYCKDMNIPMDVYSYELVQNDWTGVYNREPLEKTNVSFTCLRYKCTLGLTEYLGRGDLAGRHSYFPYCVGGILRGEKKDYKESWLRIVTQKDQSKELNLIPLWNLPLNKIKVVKQELYENGQIGPASELTSSQVASIRITFFLKNQSTTEPYHDSSVVFSPKLLEEKPEEQKLGFLAKADYNYRVDISLLEGEQLIGGYKQNWTVTWDQLEKADSLTFHVLNKKSTNEQELYGFIAGLESNSRLVPPPEWK